MWNTVRGNLELDEYKELEKSTKKMIRAAKRKFEKKLAAGGDGNKRTLFAYIKESTKS
jgi:hypothetical protein